MTHSTMLRVILSDGSTSWFDKLTILRRTILSVVEGLTIVLSEIEAQLKGVEG